MKKYLKILLAAGCLFGSAASHAIHQTISNTNTIQYCNGFCSLIDSLEVGSIFSLTGNMDINDSGVFPDDLLNTLADFTIEITGSSNTLLLTLNNTSLTSSNIFTSTDEFEQTTILGGSAIFNTTFAFAALSGIPSELIYNFDNNSINFFISGDLTASTSPVPVPSAFILFFSGTMLLISFSNKKKQA